MQSHNEDNDLAIQHHHLQTNGQHNIHNRSDWANEGGKIVSRAQANIGRLRDDIRVGVMVYMHGVVVN